MNDEVAASLGGDRRQLGRQAEELAVGWLEGQGWKILARNLWLGRLGEIDILAERRGVLHVVEVKALYGADYNFRPEDHLTPAKHKRLVRLARYLLNRYNKEACQIDLVAIQYKSGQAPELAYYPQLDA